MSSQPRLTRVIAVLALAALAALAGCSSGQVTQTARQASTVNGASAEVGDLALRNIQIIFPTTGAYNEGDTARLAMTVVNRTIAQDRLLEVTGDFFERASVPSDDTESEDTESDDTEAEASVETAIPAEAGVLFGTSDSPPIELEDLTERLIPAQTVSITFVFETAGEVTVEVPVANPTRSVRSDEPFDFHPDE